MIFLASLTAFVLTILAAIHVVWALGLTWPYSREDRLVRAVYGARGATHMPGAVSCALVAVALTFGAAWAVWLLGPDPWIIVAGGWVLTSVFIARGLSAYIPAWRRMAPVEPFATLDRRAFGPLCLALGISFLTLTVAG